MRDPVLYRSVVLPGSSPVSWSFSGGWALAFSICFPGLGSSIPDQDPFGEIFIFFDANGISSFDLLVIVEELYPDNCEKE